MNNKIILCIMFVLMLNISVVSGETGLISVSEEISKTYSCSIPVGTSGHALNLDALTVDNNSYNGISFFNFTLQSLTFSSPSNSTSFTILSGGSGGGIFSYKESTKTLTWNFIDGSIISDNIITLGYSEDLSSQIIGAFYDDAITINSAIPIKMISSAHNRELTSYHAGSCGELNSVTLNIESLNYNITYPPIENKFNVEISKLKAVDSKVFVSSLESIYCADTNFNKVDFTCYDSFLNGVYINLTLQSGTNSGNILINSTGLITLTDVYFSSDSEGNNVIETASIGDFIYLNYENNNYQPLFYTYEWYILKDNITQILGGSFLEQDLNKFINLNNFDVGSYTARIYEVSYDTSEASIISSNSIILTEPAYTMSFSKDFYSIGETVIINYNVPTPTRLHLTDLFGNVITCKICYETVNGTGTLNYTLLDSDILGEYYLSGAIIKNGITLIGQYMEVIPNEDTFIGSVITDKNSYNLSEEIIINYTSNTASSLELRDSNNNIVFGSSLFNLNGSYNLNVLNTWIIGTYTLNLYASSDGSYIDHTTFIITSQEIIFNTDKDIYYTGERLHITYAVNNNSILYLYDNENNLLHNTNLDYDGSFYNYFIPFSDTVKYPNWTLSLFDANNLSNNISKNILVYSIIDTATPTTTETVILPDAQELPSLIEVGDSVSVFVFGEVDIDNDGIDDSDIKGAFKKAFTTLMLLAFILLIAGIRKIFK